MAALEAAGLTTVSPQGPHQSPLCGLGLLEPISVFFVVIAINAEILFIAGDLIEEVYKKTMV
ncbi:hypothetical protein Cni_G09519 [Canna indica]|uniref:Uncharacterized protein n=1 Tax=Canna indica TaxID=4628 RepID=A0AAQ3K881_9LILI|nr:hypothetical protein Cni_G09519 [Canna indica]